MAITDVLRKAIHKWIPSSSQHNHSHHKHHRSKRSKQPNHVQPGLYGNITPPQSRDGNRPSNSSTHTHSLNFNTYVPENSPPRRSSTFDFLYKPGAKPVSPGNSDDSRRYPRSNTTSSTTTAPDAEDRYNQIVKDKVKAKRQKIRAEAERRAQRWAAEMEESKAAQKNMAAAAAARKRPQHMDRMERFSFSCDRSTSNCGRVSEIYGVDDDDLEGVSPGNTRHNSRAEGMQVDGDYYCHTVQVNGYREGNKMDELGVAEEGLARLML